MPFNLPILLTWLRIVAIPLLIAVPLVLGLSVLLLKKQEE